MARVILLLFYLVLCCVLAVKDKHECNRPCSKDESPKKCYYNFTIGISQRKQKTVLSINGESPGPLISVCQGDIILVNVKNQLPSGLETSIHWYGISEGNSPFMDGVPMITQCPIISHTTFRYQLKAWKPGTFFYRAHSVPQQIDGLYGPLVVRHETGQSNSEKVILISPQMKKTQVLENDYELDLNVTSLQATVYQIMQKYSDNEPVKLRVINSAALDCPVTLFTHVVPLRVFAVDGNDVKPTALNDVTINPGERVDFLVKPEIIKKIHVIGHNLCKGHDIYGFDPGIKDKNHPTLNNKNVNFGDLVNKLEPKELVILKKADVRVLLSFDSSVYTNFKGVVDFRYKLGEMTPYAPSILDKSSISISQFHNKSFLYPPSPLLSQPQTVPKDLICNSDKESERCKFYNNGFCECTQIIDLLYNYNFDLFLINEGKNSNSSETVHIHGHSFYVLSMNSFDKPISAMELWRKEVLGEIKRNLVSPLKKDTVVVPNKGYVVLRLRPTVPGKWLLESTTSKAKTGYGLEIVLNVENPLQKMADPPAGFPMCGDKKEPDLVFTDD